MGQRSAMPDGLPEVERPVENGSRIDEESVSWPGMLVLFTIAVLLMATGLALAWAATEGDESLRRIPGIRSLANRIGTDWTRRLMFAGSGLLIMAGVVALLFAVASVFG